MKSFVPKIIAALLLLVQAGFGIEDVVPQWTKTYNGSYFHSLDYGNGIALDSGGNVYVTGSTYVSSQGDNIWTRKYDKNGNEAWTRTYNGNSSQNDIGKGIAVDSSGNVFVAGSESVSSYFNIWMRKYDSSGNEIWTKTYNGAENRDDQANTITVDSSGNIYLTGYQSVSRGSYTEPHIFTMKCDSNGNEVWTKIYNETLSSRDEGKGIAVDKNGNVYVTGFESAAMQNRNICIIKYDSFGNETWVKKYNGIANGDDEGNGIAVDGSGNVYVTGFETVNGVNTNIWTRKYDSSGNEVWTKTYTSSVGNDDDSGCGITLDESGNIYVTGSVYGPGGGHSIWTRKYTSNGNVVWTKTYNESINSDDAGNSIAVDFFGNVFVAGYISVGGEDENIWVRKYRNLNAPTFAVFKIVGGKNGYINPKKDESANFVFKTDEAGSVTFKVYNLKGELVKTVTASASGLSQLDSFSYNCKNEEGNYLASGIYIVKVQGPGLNIIKKMAIMK